MKNVFALIFTCLLISSTQAKQPYSMKLKEKVYPFYQSGLSKFYAGVDKKSVHFRQFRRGSNQALIVLPGRTEPTKKYAELIYDLSPMDLDFFLWDPRGQGYSDRLLTDPQKGYVESYKDYITDFDKFMKANIIGKYDQVFILAHSMGGAISLRYAQLNPGIIDKMVLSAPMLELKTNGVPEGPTLALMRVLKTIGKKKDYVPGGGALSSPVPFTENRVTQSKERYEMARSIDVLEPELLMGSSTNNWLLEAIKLTRKTFRQRKKSSHIPMLIFQAGKDEFSKDKRQNKLCSASRKCRLVRLEEAKHEMFQEVDSVRDEVIRLTEEFLRAPQN
jgi:lysophospholipase